MTSSQQFVERCSTVSVTLLNSLFGFRIYIRVLEPWSDSDNCEIMDAFIYLALDERRAGPAVRNRIPSERGDSWLTTTMSSRFSGSTFLVYLQRKRSPLQHERVGAVVPFIFPAGGAKNKKRQRCQVHQSTGRVWPSSSFWLATVRPTVELGPVWWPSGTTVMGQAASHAPERCAKCRGPAGSPRGLAAFPQGGHRGVEIVIALVAHPASQGEPIDHDDAATGGLGAGIVHRARARWGRSAEPIHVAHDGMDGNNDACARRPSTKLAVC